MASSSGVSIPKLDLQQLVELHKQHYAISEDESISRDSMESRSISPRAIAKSPTQEIRKYHTSNSSSSEQFSVNRFTIEIPKDVTECSTKELDVLQKALGHLEKKDNNLFDADGVASNVLLMDVFAWENGSVKIDDGKPEFHTVCLWKTKAKTIKFFDPSDVGKTYGSIKANVSKLRPDLTVEFEAYGRPLEGKSKKPIEVNFYAPTKGLIHPPPIGLQDGQRRDCVDIAVKIAFVLVEAQQVHQDEKEIITCVRKLSNQSISQIGNACIGTFIRGLQSSDCNIRNAVYGFLQKNNKICEFITVGNFEDLIAVENFSAGFEATVSNPQLQIFLTKTKRITVDQIVKIDDLFKRIKALNKELLVDFPLFELEPTLVQQIDIERFIPEEGKDSNWTALHLAVINRNPVGPVLENYSKMIVGSGNDKEKIQKLVGEPDIHGQTALHWAADRGSIEDCQLVYRDMTPEQICHRMNGRLQTALHFAVHANRPDVVKLLLSRDDVREKLIDTRDQGGWAPLDWAKSRNFSKICDILDRR